MTKSQNTSKEVRGQAQALRQSCLQVMHGRHASTMPDVRITAHATRVLDAAKVLAPNNALLQQLEIRNGWLANNPGDHERRT